MDNRVLRVGLFGLFPRHFCRFSQSLYYAPTHTCTFSYAEIIGKYGVGEEFDREGEHFDTFIGDPAFVFEVLDMHLDALLG